MCRNNHVVLVSLLSFFCIINNSYSQNPELYFDDPVKMDVHINSPSEEDFPLMSHDGKRLFFNRTLHPENTGGTWAGQDIWYTEKDSLGEWTTATNKLPMMVDDYINDEYNNAVVGVSMNGDTLYLLNHYHHHKKHHFHHHAKTEPGLSYAVWQDTAWSAPIEMANPKLDFVGKHYGLFMNTSADILLISENSVNSLGLEDLYVCLKKEGNNWTEPIHLGDVINSTGFEISPFLSNDRKTLYFASNRPGGEGSCDVYFSTRLDDTWTNWSEPVNMGDKINSSGFDAYFSISDDNHILFIRNLDTLTADIFIANIVEPSHEQIDSLVLEDLFVKLSSLLDPKSFVNLEQLVNLDTVVHVKDIVDPNMKVKPTVNLDSLLYENALDFKDSVNRAKGFKVVDLHKDEVRHLDQEEFDSLKIIPRSVNIKFDLDVYQLDKEDRQVLSKVVHMLNNDKGLHVNLIGHTCDIGTHDYNDNLSKERAQSSKKYLLSRGIPEAKISMKWMGETKPIGNNETEEGRQKNRRVEIDFARNAL